MPRSVVVAAIALAVAVAIPSFAQAATVYQDGRTPYRVLFQADPGETNLVSVEGSRGVVIRDDGGTPITNADASTCRPLDAYTVRCVALRRLELDLGDGPDVAVVSTPLEVEIEGGNGPDRYVSNALGWPSRVDFDGGIGQDVANYSYATAGVSVDLDLTGPDGRPGDGDRISRTVETVIGSEYDDVLSGSEHADKLLGGDGDDQITGGAGEDVLSGGTGNDRIEARDSEPDAVDCGGQLLDWASVDLGAETSIAGCAQIAG
jgi:Ca2+-binding RTX toxin-like protein